MIFCHFTRCGEFSKGLMCLGIEYKLYTWRNSNRKQLRKIHQTIGPPAGIEPTPMRCRCTALTTKFRRRFVSAGGTLLLKNFSQLFPVRISTCV